MHIYGKKKKGKESLNWEENFSFSWFSEGGIHLLFNIDLQNIGFILLFAK